MWIITVIFVVVVVPKRNILEIAYLYVCIQEEISIDQYRVDHLNNTQFVQKNARSCSYLIEFIQRNQ